MEPSPAMRPASGHTWPVISPVLGATRLVAGAIAVHLQEAAATAEVAAQAVAGPAVLEPTGRHGRAAPAKDAVIAGTGPEPGRLGGVGAGDEGRQAGLIRKDPGALQELARNVVGQDIRLTADPAHPSGHQPPADLHLIAGMDAFLAVERQAVGKL